MKKVKNVKTEDGDFQTKHKLCVYLGHWSGNPKIKALPFIWNHMDDDPLIHCDSLNETVVPTASLPLIITT